MKPHLITTLCALLLAALFAACSTAPELANTANAYAQHFSIARSDSFTVVTIRDPWHEDWTLQTLVLVPKGQRVPNHCPQGTLVRTPLRKAVVFSSVHAALLADLDGLGSLYGMTDTAYVVRSDLREALRVGDIADFGNSVQPNLELIMSAHPDALFVSPMQGSSSHDALVLSGLPVVKCVDYMETTPLGRAEWMRLFGLFFGCEDKAERLFREVESSYNELAAAVRKDTQRPLRLMSDMKRSAAWYVPGGKSYLGTLYADAGADYIFADIKESGSVTLSPERVLMRGAGADVWLIRHDGRAPMSYESLRADFEPYTSLNPWKSRRIFVCNTLAVPYYENTPFRPDRLLRDIVHIVRPGLLPDYEPVFYKPLER